jgi:hypothetical protein
MIIVYPEACTKEACPAPPDCSNGVCQNRFLGPEGLKSTGTVCGLNFVNIFKDYWLLGKSCPNNSCKSILRLPVKSLPSNDGFSGKPEARQVTQGTLLNRLGSPTGSFLSPKGDPYPLRAAPPSNCALTAEPTIMFMRRRKDSLLGMARSQVPLDNREEDSEISYPATSCYSLNGITYKGPSLRCLSMIPQDGYLGNSIVDLIVGRSHDDRSGVDRLLHTRNIMLYLMDNSAI